MTEIISKDTAVYVLEAEEAFKGLSEEEKKYSHWMSAAGMQAAPIVLFQTSPEAPLLFSFLLKYFASLPPPLSSSTAALPKELLVYASHLFTNMGNYKSFGDSKFVPEMPMEELEKALAAASPAWKELEGLWALAKEPLYSLLPPLRHLAFPPAGISAYYSPDVTKEEAEMVQRFMDEKGLSPYNTRLFKHKGQGEGGGPLFEVRLASALDCPADDPVSPLLTTHSFHSASISVTRGDYAPFMKIAVDSLKQAAQYAANENQKLAFPSPQMTSYPPQPKPFSLLPSYPLLWP